MTDFAMCLAKDCIMAACCRRHPASGTTADDLRQVYFDASQREGWCAAYCPTYIGVDLGPIQQGPGVYGGRGLP